MCIEHIIQILFYIYIFNSSESSAEHFAPKRHEQRRKRTALTCRVWENGGGAVYLGWQGSGVIRNGDSRAEVVKYWLNHWRSRWGEHEAECVYLRVLASGELNEFAKINEQRATTLRAIYDLIRMEVEYIFILFKLNNPFNWIQFYAASWKRSSVNKKWWRCVDLRAMLLVANLKGKCSLLENVVGVWNFCRKNSKAYWLLILGKQVRMLRQHLRVVI